MTQKPGCFKNSHLCIDEIFIKTDEQIMGNHEAKIVVSTAGKQLERKIPILTFNKPKKLDIELLIERLLKESTPVHVDVFLDGHLFTVFDFVFERDTLISLYHFKDNEKYFVRIIIRAYTDGELKLQIGTLHEYKMCDFEDESIKFIGEGGFGYVLQAREKFSHKTVALKCLKDYDIKDPKNPAIREFLPFISMPHHPNIAKIYGFMFYKCCLYLVLKNYKNGSLKNLLTYLKFGELSDPDVYFDCFPRFLYGMFHCLHYMHSFGFIHRDISQENILVSVYLESRLIDFSLARGDDGDELTKYIGRDQYASPEVRSGDKYGKSTDCYSASVIVGLITVAYLLKKYSYKEVELNIVSSLEKAGPMWRKINTLIYNILDHVKPEMRLRFGEMCILIEVISDDEFTNELIDDLSVYRIEPFSLERLSYFTKFFLGKHCDINKDLVIIEFISELIKAGLNASSDFQQQYLNLMMIGGIALDLDIITFPEEFVFFQGIKYDRGRLFFYSNITPFIGDSIEIKSNNSELDKFSYYERNSLEFDEKEGFRPAKFLHHRDIKYLAMIYHEYQLVTIENDSGNTWIDRLIKGLNNGDLEYDESFCLAFNYNKNGINEIYQSIYAALADAGYVNMAVNAWKLFIGKAYGIEKAKKYIKIAMDNGDEESIKFYNSRRYLLADRNFIEYINNIKSFTESCKMGNITQSLYYFLLIIESGVDNWKSGLVSKISDYYYVILALMAQIKGNCCDYINYLKFSGLFLDEKECYNPNFEQLLLLEIAGVLLELFEKWLKSS